MKKAWLARLAVGSALALLSGCGVLSWFTSTSPKAPPPLAKGEHKLSFSTQWQARLYGDWELKPYQVTRIAVGDGQIVVADGSGHLMNLSESGHQRWMRRLDGHSPRGPSVADGVVYVGTDAGKVYAFTEADGRKKWEVQLSSEVLTPVMVTAGHLLVQTADGRLWSLDPGNGKVQWTFSMNQPTLSLRGLATPLVRDGIVYEGFADGNLVAVNLASGAELWRAPVAIAHGNNELARMVDVAASPVDWHDEVIAGAYQGNLAAYNARSGTQDWSRPMSIYQMPVIFHNHLYVADAQGRISAIDPASGTVLWRNDSLNGHYITGLGACDGELLAADSGGYLYAIDPQGGHRLGQEQVSGSGIQSTPVCLPDHQILLMSGAGTLYRIKLEKR